VGPRWQSAPVHMKTRGAAILTGAFLALGTLGAADTVHLAGGVALSGAVIYLGEASLILSVPEQGNLIVPWEKIKQVEFSVRGEGICSQGEEIAWNNELLAACQTLAALDPARALFMDLGLTWMAVALGSYLEARCGRPPCFSISCALATLGMAKAVWDIVAFPKQEARLQAKIARLRELGQARGYVFRGCYVRERELWTRAW